MSADIDHDVAAGVPAVAGVPAGAGVPAAAGAYDDLLASVTIQNPPWEVNTYPHQPQTLNCPHHGSPIYM